MKVLKKGLFVVVSYCLLFSFIHGAKKKNINKYIFNFNNNTLVVFDGATKTIQKKKFDVSGMINVYFPKHEKIVVRVYTASKEALY